jgi:hypothetical protein
MMTKLALLFLLFQSRVAYPPLEAKLKAKGGDRAHIVRASSTADLQRLQSGKRYKFVVDEAGTLLIAPLPADAPDNEYVHPILAGGGPVRTAGGITVENQAKRVILDQDSKAYCPTLSSLEEAVKILGKLGVDKVEIRNRPGC